MKIRHGFVSNSSSSSFCCLTTKEISEKAEATLTNEEQATLNGDDGPLFSYDLADMVLIGYESSSNDDGHSIGPHYSEDCDCDLMERCDNAAQAWKAAVEKVGGENAIIKININL